MQKSVWLLQLANCTQKKHVLKCYVVYGYFQNNILLRILRIDDNVLTFIQLFIQGVNE